MGRPSLKARIATETIRMAAKALLTRNPSVRALRHGLEKLMQWLPGPASIEVQKEIIGGISGRWVLRETKSADNPLLLYLHGGAYALGSSQSHTPMAARLIHRIPLSVFLPDYRLAPENPFPAALDDCESTYRALCERFPGRTIFLAGDSAGGGLCLALLNRIQKAKLRPPAGTLLFSPWCDLSCELPDARIYEKKDPYLTVEIIRKFGAYYAGNDWHNPEASPLFAEMNGWGDILIQVGGNEILRADAEALQKKSLNYTQVNIEVEIFPGMFHVFQAGDGVFPEAGQAMDKACEWLNARMQLTRQI